jgi:hypothetical protein
MKHGHENHFGVLEIGARFFWGGHEHVKTCDVFQGVDADHPQGLGFTNCIRISDGLASGMGELVAIETKRSYQSDPFDYRIWAVRRWEELVNARNTDGG